MDIFLNIINDTREPKVGDSVEWSGNFLSGFLQGVNKITKIYRESGYYWMELENNKCFIIKPANRFTNKNFKDLKIGWNLKDTL
jgi:hypothetical protein